MIPISEGKKIDLYMTPEEAAKMKTMANLSFPFIDVWDSQMASGGTSVGLAPNAQIVLTNIRTDPIAISFFVFSPPIHFSCQDYSN